MANVTEDFEVFYKTYFSDVYRYVYRVFSDKDVTDDVVQEIFVTALEKFGDVAEHPYPRRWLFCTARNKVLETFRKMRRWDNNVVPLEQGNAELSRTEYSYDVKELELAVSAMYGKKEWKVFEDYYLYGVTIAELAQTAGISENNMRVRLTRLKKKLKSTLGY